MLQSIQGGAAARPFETHHNAYDIPLFLRIAPELYLKRLLVGGYGKVFEINRNFRNEGVSPRHNPEFTMLEAYEAYGNYETMAEMVEDMICTIAQDVCGSLRPQVHFQGIEIGRINLEGDTSAPVGRRWRRVRMSEIVRERTHWRFQQRSLFEESVEVTTGIVNRMVMLEASSELLTVAKSIFGEEAAKSQFLEAMTNGADWLEKAIQDFDAKRGARKATISRLRALTPAEQLVDVFERLIEHTLIDPTFVTHVPSTIIPLARPNEDDPFFCDVYELIINGQEISPGYTELNDPDVQADLFRQQVGDEAEKQDVDEDFLNALKVGMPPAGGMGLGVDRLVMMLTGAESIRDVLLFPLMKEKGQ